MGVPGGAAGDAPPDTDGDLHGPADAFMGRGGIGRWGGSGKGRRWSAQAAAAVELGAVWLPLSLYMKPWDNLEHFTWWGIGVHVAMLAAEAVGGKAWWGTDICIQVVVLVGVWAMSLVLECDLLRDSESDVGRLRYIGGNFVLHYFPVVSAYARRDYGKPCFFTPYALLLWLVYNAVVDPGEVYGCEVPRRVVQVGGGVVAAVASLLPLAA